MTYIPETPLERQTSFSSALQRVWWHNQQARPHYKAQMSLLHCFRSHCSTTLSYYTICTHTAVGSIQDARLCCLNDPANNVNQNPSVPSAFKAHVHKTPHSTVTVQVGPNSHLNLMYAGKHMPCSAMPCQTPRLVWQHCVQQVIFQLLPCTTPHTQPHHTDTCTRHAATYKAAS
jgi:hypothetical protein